MSLRHLIVSVCAGLLGMIVLPGTALAQKAALVQDVDAAARAPFQQIMIFNQGASTCTAFVCSVTFPAVPAGKRLEVTYVSGLFGVPGGGASIVVRSSASNIGIYLPLPQNSGGNVYIGGGPVTFYVEPGNSPVIELAGYNVNASSTSAQAAIVGHLVTLP